MGDPANLRPARLAAAVLALVAAAATAQDLKELARQSRDSVVLLNVFGPGGQQTGAGTGFFVEGGRIVTNYHVVAGASRVEAVLASGATSAVVGVLAADEVNDLAILAVGSGEFPPLTLGDATGIEPGEEIVVLGNPLGLAGSLSEGIVSAVRTEGLASDPRPSPGIARPAGPPLLQISAPISPGSSGSPVMNLDGEVIGVAVSQYVLGQNLNFAVPAAAVRELLREADAGRLRKSFRSRPTFAGRGYLINVAISLVFFAAVYLAFRYLR